MPPRRLASLRTMKRIQDVNQLKTADIETMNFVSPYGKSHLAVRPLGCSDGSLLAANATPGRAPEPGSQINVARPQGGSGLFAFPAVALGGGGSTQVAKQETVAPPPANKTPLIALRATSVGDGTITFDVAAFIGSAFVETLHTGLVVTGFFATGHPNNTVAGARGQLKDARSLVGLTGVPDGSIGFRTTGFVFNPTQSTFNIINIETGAVTSRIYDPLFVPIIDGGSVPGWDYLNDKIYFSWTAELRTRIQISTFPPDLSSQSILTDETPPSDPPSDHRVVAFYESDAIFGTGVPVDKWDRMPYSGGTTDAFVTGSSPGNRFGGHPQALGLAGGKYWHVGRADTGGGIDTSRRDIQVYTTIDIADVGANGFTSLGLAENFAHYQTWNGGRSGQYDFNRDRTAIIGFPIWTSPGPAPSPDGTPAIVSIPLTATDWSEASFVQMSTSPFRPDSVIADGREA